MPLILNKSELATNELRKDALEILEAGLEAIDTEKVLRKKVKVENGVLKMAELPSLNIREGFGGELDLKNFNKIIFIGIGKCALQGARVLEEILGDYLAEGIVLDVRPTIEAKGLRKMRYFVGTHPYPSEQNVAATREILKMVENLTEKDLVITLISGGGSALFELPIEGVSLDDIIQKTKELTTRGADIYGLNAARKEMSQVKGGKFAKICEPAQVVSLIFSDVLGNDISVIASGPTVIEEAGLPSPDQGEGYAQRGVGFVKNILLVSNHDALSAMKSKAEELGYNTKIETENLSGNAAEVGEELAKKEIGERSCILLGGETTVKIAKNHGEGGRNQELVLSALLNISKNYLIASVASDGWDNTPHAGALIDAEILQKSKELNLNPQEFLERSDSYNFFKQIGGAISTGRLGSNVADLVIMLNK